MHALHFIWIGNVQRIVRRFFFFITYVDRNVWCAYLFLISFNFQNAFSLTVNERFQLNGDYIGLAEWILGRHREQWIGLLTRAVMEDADSYKEAEKMLISTTLIAPVYFILAGVKRHQVK